jgi:hypothetical protein
MVAFLALASWCRVDAQDSTLLHMLNDSMNSHPGKSYVTGTFKATHVVNMQTVESAAAGNLNFIIQHRFGTLNSGAYNFFGLDNATLRLGLDYGITDDLEVGIGRSSYMKTFDGHLKWRAFRQMESGLPVTISLSGTITNYTQNLPDKPYLTNKDKIAYAAELLIARKFGSRFSFQITPTYLHFNTVSTANDKNDVLGLGLGGRLKITKRMSINAEYNYAPSSAVTSSKVYNSVSLGWDIETGGHVFQLVFTNSQSMLVTQYMTGTTGTWGDGAIYFGFNISRNFNLKKKPKSSEKM